MILTAFPVIVRKNLDGSETLHIKAPEIKECEATLYAKTLKIEGLFLETECRRQGLGRSIIEALEAEAKRRGATTARICTSQMAEGFWRKMGFTLRYRGANHLTGLKVLEG